jgi:hypothetical protein
VHVVDGAGRRVPAELDSRNRVAQTVRQTLREFSWQYQIINVELEYELRFLRGQ